LAAAMLMLAQHNANELDREQGVRVIERKFYTREELEALRARQNVAKPKLGKSHQLRQRPPRRHRDGDDDD
jgi:hypothetical protein